MSSSTTPDRVTVSGAPVGAPRARAWWWRAALVAATIATLVPVVVIVRAVAIHARNFPWMDQWGEIPFMAEVAAGRLPVDALWVEVNEHRIPVALLLQGAVAWWTRWDVRGDAWTNVGLALGSLLTLISLARRALPAAATPALAPIFAMLVFSPIASTAWTAAWTTPMFAATFFATVTARLAAGEPTWPRIAATMTAAALGALSFGSGLMLLVLVPVVWLVMPGTAPRRRGAHVAVALAGAAALVSIYFAGWYPRWDIPTPVFHPERATSYVRYALVYLGGATGARTIVPAWWTGAVTLAAGVIAIVALWWRAPSRRRALVPWVLLVLYGLGSGLVTAYGRLDVGMMTALLARYSPTAGLFVAGVAAVVSLAVAELYDRSPRAATALLLAIAIALGVAGRRYVDAAGTGLTAIRVVSRQIDGRSTCLRSCATATTACFAGVCWDADIARRLCPAMEGARIGPFVASGGRPG